MALSGHYSPSAGVTPTCHRRIAHKKVVPGCLCSLRNYIIVFPVYGFIIFVLTMYFISVVSLVFQFSWYFSFSCVVYLIPLLLCLHVFRAFSVGMRGVFYFITFFRLNISHFCIGISYWYVLVNLYYCLFLRFMLYFCLNLLLHVVQFLSYTYG